ncbi:centromere protein T isoform X2 [Stegostoma tigrinum]|uniref:centromere protein T isoform X2 n=1 Tax=Stegostoma tigrinum TaxID=3053191 RepID=UPI00286FC5CE|nr:centromere protein T isoform X2 [Stegostoma tigrinum]
MDSLPEDMTMRTLIKGMIAEEVPQSIVRPGTHRLRKKTSTPKKLIDVPMQQSPSMVLRSQMKAKVKSSQLAVAAVAAESSKKQTTGKNSVGLKKVKTVRAISQEALDDYTPRSLLKKFMQTEPESSLIKVVNPGKEKSVQKKSQPKTKLSSGSLSAEDTTEQNLLVDCKIRKQEISVSVFEKATQKRLQQTAETEQCDKSSRLPDISTMVSLINPDFEESTTKPMLCRRPKKRKIINEDDFEEGVHNYLEQGKELGEIERTEPFEKTSGLTDISRIVGSINFDTDESVSKPVLSRRPRRDKLISEDDFEEGVLFYLQQAKEKPVSGAQDTSSDSAEKEKSSAHTLHDEFAATELYTSPWPAKSSGMKAVAVETEEMKSAFHLKSGLELEKETELSVRVEDKLIKVANAGRASSLNLFKENNLSDNDHQIAYTSGKCIEDLATGEESTDHGIQIQGGAKENQFEPGGSGSAIGSREMKTTNLEEEAARDDEYRAAYNEFKMVRDAGQNLAMSVEQESAISRQSEGMANHEGMLVDEVGDKTESNKLEAETTKSEGVKDDEKMEGDAVDDAPVEGDAVDDAPVEGEAVDDAPVEGEAVDDAPVEGEAVDDAPVEGEAVDDAPVEGDALYDAPVEGDAVDDYDEKESDELLNREELTDNSESEEDDSKVRLAFQQSDQGFRSSPLLTTPHFLKILGSKAQKPLVKVKQNSKKTTKAQKKTILPSSFVKSVFTHYAKMRVKKETFAVVEQCLELYFKQLCDDIDVYSKHAKRRTIEKEDLELLMKRQGFVTAKMPLNVLIERHLSMECREKLIPMAVSGSKIIPKK